METFNALVGADDVRTFPDIDMPAPLPKPQAKKSSYSDEYKKLFYNNSSGPEKAAVKLPGLLKTRKTKLAKDKPAKSDGQTFTGFNSTHFKLDMNQKPPAAYDNISEYKTTAKPKQVKGGTALTPHYVSAQDMDLPMDMSQQPGQMFDQFRPQQIQTQNGPSTYAQKNLLSQSMPVGPMGYGYGEEEVSPGRGGGGGGNGGGAGGRSPRRSTMGRSPVGAQGNMEVAGAANHRGSQQARDDGLEWGAPTVPGGRSPRNHSSTGQRRSIGSTAVAGSTSTMNANKNTGGKSTLPVEVPGSGRDDIGNGNGNGNGSVMADMEEANSLAEESLPGSMSGIQRSDPTMDELRNYITLMDKYSLHNFMIYEGKALHQTPEFQSFKRSYQHKWGAISGIISQLEEYLVKYEVKLAMINGPRLFELSKMNMPSLGKDEIHSLIQNIDQIEMQMETTNEVKTSQTNRLITKLQARIRLFLERMRYRKYQRRVDACVQIQSIARRMVYRMRSRGIQQQYGQMYDLAWSTNRGLLEDWWRERAAHEQLERHRLIVYVPSISAAEYQRMDAENFLAAQNTHCSVLSMLADPDVTVLYITPFHLTNSDKSYHEKFLALLGVSVLPKRLYFISPELINKLPHHLSLSLVLWCSSAALNKIRTFTRKFKMSVILPATVSWVERRLSNLLSIPLFSPEPGVSEIISSRSFAKGIFTETGVNMPLGSHDIFSVDDLFIAMSRLIACNVGVCRWVIRLNYDWNNLSCVYIDTERLPLVLQLRKEQHDLTEEKNNPTAWFTRQVQLSVRKRVINMLKADFVSKLRICRPDIYPSWDFYVRLVRQYGAVIEAEPIEKLGTVEGICCVDPMGNIVGFNGVELCYDNNYQFEHYMFPQRITPMQALEGATRAVVQKLFEQHHVIGYVTVRFISFWDAFDKLPRMWAVGLQFGMTSVFGAIGTAAIATKPPSPSQIPQMPLSLLPDIPEDKFCLYIPLAVHDPLKSTHDDVFFKVCRMRGIAFDIQNRVGSLFFLVDSVVSGAVSILCVASSRVKSIELAIHTVGFVVREFGMDAITNRLRGENMTNLLQQLKRRLKHENRESAAAAAAFASATIPSS